MLVNMCLTSSYINPHFLRYEAHHFHIQGFSDMFLLSTSMCTCHTYYIDSGYNVPMPATLLYYFLWFALIILHKNRRAVKNRAFQHMNNVRKGMHGSHSQFSRSWISLLFRFKCSSTSLDSRCLRQLSVSSVQTYLWLCPILLHKPDVAHMINASRSSLATLPLPCIKL